MEKIKWRIVRTADGYNRESIDHAHTRKEALALLSEYRLSDNAGLYEIIAYRKRAEDK